MYRGGGALIRRLVNINETLEMNANLLENNADSDRQYSQISFYIAYYFISKCTTTPTTTPTNHLEHTARVEYFNGVLVITY